MPWLTRDLKKLMQERDYHHKKALSTNKEQHWSNYMRLRNTINTRMRKEKIDYYANQLADEKDPKVMWRTLHKIVPQKIKSVPSSSDGLTASRFNGFFVLCQKLCQPELNKTLFSKRCHPALFKKNCSK